MLICPVCRTPLSMEVTSWSCVQRHSFDVSRDGYINLLLVQQKKSLNPGDTLASLRARREFLDAGHYAPLRDTVIARMPEQHAGHWLDIGCGEGYYTSAMVDHADSVMGLDISKAAVQLAARRYREARWLVASAAALPLADNSIEGCSSLFAPVPQDLIRVLRPGGALIMVRPDTDHLHSVRKALFGEVRPHQPEKVITGLPPELEVVDQEHITFDLNLNNTSLKLLLAMTPYAWKAKPERKQTLESEPGFCTQASFVVNVLRKL